MEYQITNIIKLDEEHIQVIGKDGDFIGVQVHLPYRYAKGTHIHGRLLVTVDKPGFIGWLKRKIISW